MRPTAEVTRRRLATRPDSPGAAKSPAPARGNGAPGRPPRTARAASATAMEGAPTARGAGAAAGTGTSSWPHFPAPSARRATLTARPAPVWLSTAATAGACAARAPAGAGRRAAPAT